MTPNDIILYSDKFLIQSSSENLPPVEDENEYRGLQADTIQTEKPCNT